MRSATADLSSSFSLYSIFIHLSCIKLTILKNMVCKFNNLHTILYKVSISSYVFLPVDKPGGGAGLTLPLQRRLGDYPTFSWNGDSDVPVPTFVIEILDFRKATGRTPRVSNALPRRTYPCERTGKTSKELDERGAKVH